MRRELQQLRDAVDQLVDDLQRAARRLRCRLAGHEWVTLEYGSRIRCVRCGWRW